MKRRIISLLLAIMILGSLSSLTALAAATAYIPLETTIWQTIYVDYQSRFGSRRHDITNHDTNPGPIEVRIIYTDGTSIPALSAKTIAPGQTAEFLFFLTGKDYLIQARAVETSGKYSITYNETGFGAFPTAAGPGYWSQIPEVDIVDIERNTTIRNHPVSPGPVTARVVSASGELILAPTTLAPGEEITVATPNGYDDVVQIQADVQNIYFVVVKRTRFY